MDRNKIVDYINKYLKNDEFKDFSKNGLQVEGTNNINKILFSVSISLDVIKEAIKNHCEMIIVHHGLFWGKERVITGTFKEKIKMLLENDINLCAWHLPLDAHPEIGNNAIISNFFIFNKKTPFGKYEGKEIGFEIELKKPLNIKKVVDLLKTKLNTNPLILNFGPEEVKRLAIVSGGAQKLFEEAIERKLDLFITGEVSEFCFEMARENNINFIAAGHYATEKTGIIALQKFIQKKFKINTLFYDTQNPV